MRAAVGAAALAAAITLGAPTAALARPFPLAADRIVVFNDQVSEQLTDAQLRFVATRYGGSQKQSRSFARRLRAQDPGYCILHYRLGLGLGYRSGGQWLRIVDGDRWVREWPWRVQERWFYHYRGRRFLQHQWGWYLANPDDTAWRYWWSKQVIRQMYTNEDDGIFADSYSVPNYLGGSTFTPRLPDYAPAFEGAWSARIDRFTRYMDRRVGTRRVFIVNAGSWVTMRDRTDYGLADGVMIEGLGAWGSGSPFDESDWVLQQDRILSLARRGRIVIGQAYLDSPDDTWMRQLAVGSYLLSKGRRSYVNLDLGYEPEWFPEYELDLGAAADALPASVAAYRDPSGLYRRSFAKGLVVVNPSDGPITRSVAALAGSASPYDLAGFVGGGYLPEDADVSSMGITRTPVDDVTVEAHSAEVLLLRL